VYVFDSKPNKTNLDKVADFSVADDSIWLENKIFTKLSKKGSETAPAQIKNAFFVVGDKAKDDYLIYNKKAGKLYYDADGSGSKAAIEIATLSKKLSLTYKDFFVI
jgi:Ca2+-binding RTX toxin-like protein